MGFYCFPLALQTVRIGLESKASARNLGAEKGGAEKGISPIIDLGGCLW